MGRSRNNKGSREPQQRPGEQEGASEPAANERELPSPAVPAPKAAQPAAGRAYTVAYGRVWDAAVSVIQGMERWTVVSSDPVRGEILLQIRGLMRRAPRSARIAVWLDEVGLTRLEAVILDSGRTGPMDRFYRLVEKRLAGGR